MRFRTNILTKKGKQIDSGMKADRHVTTILRKHLHVSTIGHSSIKEKWYT